MRKHSWAQCGVRTQSNNLHLLRRQSDAVARASAVRIVEPFLNPRSAVVINLANVEHLSDHALKLPPFVRRQVLSQELCDFEHSDSRSNAHLPTVAVLCHLREHYLHVRTSSLGFQHLNAPVTPTCVAFR